MIRTRNQAESELSALEDIQQQLFRLISKTASNIISEVMTEMILDFQAADPLLVPMTQTMVESRLFVLDVDSILVDVKLKFSALGAPLLSVIAHLRPKSSQQVIEVEQVRLV